MGDKYYIFSNSYKPTLGGVQTVTSQLAEAMNARGMDVVVVTKFSRNGWMPYDKIGGVRIYRFLFEYKITFLFLFILFICRRPETVFVHFPQEQAWFVSNLRKFFSFRLITCFHGHDALMYKEGYSMDNELYRSKRKLVHSSDRITACSEYLARVVESIFGISGVRTVHNGVDLSRFKNITPLCVALPYPYIFAFGRIEKIKGFDMLISAFAKSDVPDKYRLVIAGDGSQREELLKLSRELGIEDRICLIGRVTQAEIVGLAQHSEFIVIPSRREPFGIVTLEAIAAKRPIVATDSGGTSEVMNLDYGYLVEASIDGIRGGIEKILQGKIFDFTSVDDYLMRFSIDKMVDKYLTQGYGN